MLARERNQLFFVAPALLLMIAVGSGCGDDDDDDGTINTDGNAGAGGFAGTTAGTGGAGGTGGTGDGTGDGADGRDGTQMQLTDGQVAGVIAIANAGEVQQGQLALMRAETSDVQDYAGRMVLEHTAANERLTELLTEQELFAEPSPLGQQLSLESMRIIAMLEDETDDGFDRAYMQAQQRVHARVLELLETTLDPNVDHEALEMELETLRTTVTAHLEEAEDLLAALTE